MLKVEDVGHCELCGSKRNLEVHHIVPRTACDGIIDPNEDDNLIVVCGSCHSKLTPKRFLCNYGKNKMPIEGGKGNHKQLWDMRFFYEHLTECDDIVDLVEYIWAPWLTKEEKDARAETIGL